jgi:hypothetical protein
MVPENPAIRLKGWVAKPQKSVEGGLGGSESFPQGESAEAFKG